MQIRSRIWKQTTMSLLSNRFTTSVRELVKDLFRPHELPKKVTGADLFGTMEPIMKGIQKRQEVEEERKRQWLNWNTFQSAKTCVNSWLSFLLLTAVIIITTVGLRTTPVKFSHESQFNGSHFNESQFNQPCSVDFANSVVLCIVSICQSWHVLCRVFNYLGSLLKSALMFCITQLSILRSKVKHDPDLLLAHRL